MKKVLAVFVAALITASIIQCTNDNKNKQTDLGPGVFLCNAEELNEKGNKFLSYGNEFGGYIGRTSVEKYEGDFSCLTDTSMKYAMTYTFKDLKPNEVFDISVYRKSLDDIGIIVAESLEGKLYVYEWASCKSKDSNGWDVLRLKLQLPENVEELKGLKVYAFNGEETGRKIYFDNLRVSRSVKSLAKTPAPKGSFHIQLTDNDYSKIKGLREQALRNRVITKDLKKEFDGFLKYKGKTYKIGIRLKGDWTDHLRGDKWSYRIRVKDGESILGLKTFSIQKPEARDYLQEWVIHKACNKEDILTTTFEYLPVVINGMDFGLYNLEEHFVKQLVESRNRREGLIFKFGEDGFWDINLFNMRNGFFPSSPFYEAAIISSFKMKKVLKSKKLNDQFKLGQKLMLKYKKGDPDIEKYINVEQFAKTYALMDLGNVKHFHAWHNQRFYYNPITSKLELIVYDCYSGPGEALRRTYGIRGNSPVGEHLKGSSSYGTISVFDEPIFQALYLKYLKKYSSEEFLQEFLGEIKGQLDSLESQIKEEEYFYNYDYSFLENNAKKIRAELVAYENKVKKQEIKFVLKEKKVNECISENPFKHISLNAYLEEVKPNGSVLLSLQNFHCKPILIVGYSSKQFPDSVLKVAKKIKLGDFPKDKRVCNLSLKVKPKKLYYRVVGDDRDTLFNSKIIPWPIPTTEIPYAEMAKPLQANAKEYVLEGKKITFKKGKHIVKDNIVIPSGMTVTFEPGVDLVFDKGTFLMSYSAVKMIGSQKEPIKISSTDGTGGGFTVLEGEKESYLRNVIFDGLNTFNQSGWSLTGAVTFYESKVNIDSTIFTNNKCEDGLNIIRSTFSLSNSTISNTYSDGFDADFCEGVVSLCTFTKTGNDCLDFSGSKVAIVDCNLSESGDKGISCGEQSQVKIDNVFINGAVLGIASKDNSIVDVRKVQLKNCKTGFSVFQKKSEYGPASISVDGYELIGVEVLSDIESGSKLELKNKIENTKTLEGYIKKIKSDKKWMESIKVKAKKREVSVEEMVEIDARYALEKNS